ncbi:hypothetical protein [Streptomyces bambusae]|nr:hypothetical protein [Streptomyces bambusae]
MDLGIGAGLDIGGEPELGGVPYEGAAAGVGVPHQEEITALVLEQ